MYESKYPIPAVTSDAIIHDSTDILLIKRKDEPFKGKWAFPGGHLNEYESARECCCREVKEETGLWIGQYCPHTPIDIFGAKGRDPRGWVISFPFLVKVPDQFYTWDKIKAGDDAEDVKWFSLSEVRKKNIELLAFDHFDILNRYVFNWGIHIPYFPRG